VVSSAPLSNIILRSLLAAQERARQEAIDDDFAAVLRARRDPFAWIAHDSPGGPVFGLAEAIRG
jgi:hypothetical protein